MPRNRWYFSAAALAFGCGVVGLSELYLSRDLSGDWHGPAWVLIGLVWLYVAYSGSDHRPEK